MATNLFNTELKKNEEHSFTSLTKRGAGERSGGERYGGLDEEEGGKPRASSNTQLSWQLTHA